MNTIIVPTDFSAASESATTYAARLARQLNASVLLLHVYQLPVPMTDYPVLMITHEDLKKGADEGLERARESAEKTYSGVLFETESRLGDVAYEIEEACKERNAFALIVGTKDVSGFERFLFGDTTLSLIKKSSFPVIAVPEGAEARMPRNVVLASDLSNLDEIPTEQIVAIINRLEAALHVVHVETNDEKTASPDRLLQMLSGTKASFHNIKDEDVAEGLNQFVTQNNIDLVLVLPHKHNLYERLFFKGHTQGIIQELQVPVMSLRKKQDEE